MDTTAADRKFKPLFSLLDTDQDGAINLNDILRPAEKARQQLGWATGDARYLKLVQTLKAGWTQSLQLQDIDHNGSLSYQEYLSLFLRLGLEWSINGVLPAWAVELSNNLQSALDFNGDGAFTADEYAIYLRSIGSDADAQSVFAKLDINKNGKLTADEVQVLAKQLAGSTDPAAPGNYLLTGKY
jgi:hypothetical protein